MMRTGDNPHSVHHDQQHSEPQPSIKGVAVTRNSWTFMPPRSVIGPGSDCSTRILKAEKKESQHKPSRTRASGVAVSGRRPPGSAKSGP